MKRKNKIIWVNFLHIYQPPWQQPGVIEQVSSESYEYLVTLLEKYKKFRATINITGNLIEQLYRYRPDLLLRIKKLVSKGNIELTGSAKYHALLPLLPDDEVVRQIKLNKEVLDKHFPKQTVNGFYLPEMSYSDKVGKLIKKLGYQWIILDPIVYAGQVDNSVSYKIKNIGLKVVFRNRDISKNYPAEIIYKDLENLSENKLFITGSDGEMYGHFHEDWQGHLEKVASSYQVDILTVGGYLKNLKKTKIIKLKSGSWESKAKELDNKIPFALWQHPKNKIHTLLWELVNLSYKLLKKYPQDKNYKWARRHLDRGLSSCTFWWASATKPSIFSPLTWNPDMIDNGSEELVRVVRSLARANKNEKIRAEKLYIEIKKTTWLKHWAKYNQQ